MSRPFMCIDGLSMFEERLREGVANVLINLSKRSCGKADGLGVTSAWHATIGMLTAT